MELSFNCTIEGKQYFVVIDEKVRRLEYSFDNVNPLAGGGATFVISSDLVEFEWQWQDIRKVFGAETANAIYALALTLENIDFAEVKKGTALFYEKYAFYIQEVKEKNLFSFRRNHAWPQSG